MSSDNTYGYLEILKQYDRHLNILDLVFQQDNTAVHKKEVFSQFSGPKSSRDAGLASLQS